MKFFIIQIIILSVVFLLPAGTRAGMSSETYQINADVVGLAGELGTSENYKLTDTIGEPVTGIGSSENYSVKAGFLYMVNFSISLLVDSNTVALGTVTPGTPVTGESTLTVTTDSWGGYDLLIKENHSLTHTDAVTTIPDYSCSISSPCAWSGTGLGFTVKSGSGINAKWGSNPNYKYAAIPSSSTVIHDKTGYTSGGDQTVVEYKVDAPQTQKSGTYSNIITYTALAEL